MFGRRRRPALFGRLRELLWPRAGWRRAGAYYGHRMGRLPGSPHRIASGFAWGVALSFTPFFGLHFALAAVLAWATGGNILAAALGTAIGNPWTFPVIWFAAYRAGAWILGDAMPHEPPDPFTMSAIVDNPGAIFLPMAIGGLPMAAGAWLISFWLVRRAVARYQQLRTARIERRRRRGAPWRARPGGHGGGRPEVPEG